MDDLDYYNTQDDQYDDSYYGGWPSGLCEICGVPYYVNGISTHHHVYPKKKLGFFARWFGSKGDVNCLVCGHTHGEHLQPWVKEWAMQNMDQMALQRLATLIVIDHLF